MTREGKRYLAQVKRRLVCRRAELLPPAVRLVENFCQEEPDSDDPAALVSAFGPADHFAAEMLATLEPIEVDAARKRRKYLRRALVAGFSLVLVLASAFWFLRYQRSVELGKELYIVQYAPAVFTGTDEEWEALSEQAPESARAHGTKPPSDP